jgi:hypothetical protein
MPDLRRPPPLPAPPSKLADALIEHETLTSDQIAAIVERVEGVHGVEPVVATATL